MRRPAVEPRALAGHRSLAECPMSGLPPSASRLRLPSVLGTLLALLTNALPRFGVAPLRHEALMAMPTTPYQRHDQISLSTSSGTVGTCTSFSQAATASVEWRELAQPWSAANYPAEYTATYRYAIDDNENTVLSPASGSGRWHVCWDEPTAPEGLNSRALRHLHKSGCRVSMRNYRQACKAVGRHQ